MDKSSVAPIDGHLVAPVIYFDAVPTGGVRAGVVSLSLAVHLGEPVTTSNTTDHLVAVANLRFALSTAASLRDMLDKILLAARPTEGSAN